MSPPVEELLSGFWFPADAVSGKTATAVPDSPLQVQSLLDEHPSLIDLLAEIRAKLRDYFAEAPVSLSAARDPDETARVQLVVAVTTDLSPGEALDRLAEFDRDWWLDNLARAQGKVCVDVEYR
jgi:hypothetical protein